MRYVTYKTIVSKTLDTEIDDKVSIQKLLEELKAKEVTCTIILMSGEVFQNVRILKIEDEKVVYRVTKHQSTLIKTSLITNIRQLEINTQTEVTATLKPEVSRWNLLEGVSEASV